MTFLNPTAFWGLLLVVPIVASYLLKTHVRQTRVSTLMFWHQAFDQLPPRTIGGRLRHIRSLLCQLLLLSLLIFALANPVSSAHLATVRNRVLIIDNSSSMQTPHGDTDRLTDALQKAEDIINRLRPQEQLTILQTTPGVQVLAASTEHKRSLKRALQKIEPAAGPAMLDEALHLATELLRQTDNGQIVLLSDHTVVSDDRTADLQQQMIGTAADNVGITDFQIRRTLTDAIGYERMLEVANFSDHSVDCKVDLSIDDQLIDVLPLTLAAGEIRRIIQSGTSDTGGVLKAELRCEQPSKNRFKQDDLAWSVLPAVQQLDVTLATEGNLFLQTALSANDAVRLSMTKPAVDDRNTAGLLVLHKQVPANLPAGPLLIVQPTGSTDLWQVDGLLQNPFAEISAPSSRLLQHVNLNNVVMPAAVKLNMNGPHEVLIEAETGDPLYLRIARPVGDVFVLSVDLDQSDLPLRTAFPILLSNLVNHLAGNSTEFKPAIAAGAAARIRVPESGPQHQTADSQADGQTAARSDPAASAAGRLQLVSPRGRRIAVTANGPHVHTPPLDEIGIWRLVRNRADAEPVLLQTVACNLMNRSESNVNRTALSAAGGERKAGSSISPHPAWLYLAAIAAVLLCVEWSLFHRRRIA